ncbi:hypothetical protein QBZ16_002441 [Prototheca wickerhamii]|uniref:Biotin carboxyl carrier protein of acetyl-CoA carboxylase n=1 Tax=Prototheca wickerhamii TaxID=3111 RepID=A0AAD9INE4_PROWI|nr:hypothetical protein QBZ16_002441 [Prototheca wickerhamii]
MCHDLQVSSRSSVATRAAGVEEAKAVSANGVGSEAQHALDFDELTGLIKMVHSTDIVELELNSKKFKLTVKKKEALEVAEPQGVEISSPMSGTFYASPAPGEPPFVKVGDSVKKGQTVCIIEAMKLMNEIEAESSGTIVKVVAEHGKPVTPGAPLFIIKP